MGYVLLIVGLLMIVTGVRNTYREFGNLLVSDFTGAGNFTYWIVALGAIGALGYIKPLQTFSRAFMFLIIVGMILANRGFFARFTEALNAGPQSVKSAENGNAPSARITVNPKPRASNDNAYDGPLSFIPSEYRGALVSETGDFETDWKKIVAGVIRTGTKVATMAI